MKKIGQHLLHCMSRLQTKGSNYLIVSHLIVDFKKLKLVHNRENFNNISKQICLTNLEA